MEITIYNLIASSKKLRELYIFRLRMILATGMTYEQINPQDIKLTNIIFGDYFITYLIIKHSRYARCQWAHNNQVNMCPCVERYHAVPRSYDLY